MIGHMDPVIAVEQDKHTGQRKSNPVLSAAALFHYIGQHRQGKHHAGDGHVAAGPALEEFVFVRSVMDGKVLEDGKLTFGSGAPAVMAVCFLAILITLAVKTVRNRKEADE